MLENQKHGNFGTFYRGQKSISVHVNDLNAQVRNVYDHHEHLGTLYGDSACFEPMSESVVGVHWSRIAQLRFPVTEHFTWVSTTRNLPINNVPHVFYTIKVR